MNPNQSAVGVVDSLPPHHQQQSGHVGPNMLTSHGAGPTSGLCSAGAMNGTLRSCGGCGGKIIDRFLLHALDRYWHTACLKCSCCGATLADIGGSCFTKAGMILCKSDYIREKLINYTKTRN
uniref:LIM zinc-binding domain-containing protein n=1 Tax=Strigamia maritima TaxID=126957 RepID=T1J798_STRMM